MTSVNEVALLRAILDDPADDLPRLALADWWEERGEDARAEFVRVQLELDRLRRLGCHEGEACNVTGQCAECGREVEAERLRRVERQLVYLNIGQWLGGMPDELTTQPCHFCRDGSPDWETGVVECRQCDSTGLLPNYDGLEFRRGFVERVEMTTDDFFAHAKAIFSRHPITEVVLTDREPYFSAGHSWFNGLRTNTSMHPQSDLPFNLYRLLLGGEKYASDLFRDYLDKATALADLSRACVRYGRAEAGLGEL